MADQSEAATAQSPHPCPFCGGDRTEVMSLFGSHASLTTCWCEDCRSPFEFLRWREADPGSRGQVHADGGSGEAPDAYRATGGGGGTGRADAPKRRISGR